MRTMIDIGNGIIPDGYEAVAFRVPVEGEYIIDNLGGLLEITIHISVSRPRLILQKTWMWPKWLTACQLQWSGNYWVAKSVDKDGCLTCWSLNEDMIAGEMPPDKSRVYYNPNRKGGA